MGDSSTVYNALSGTQAVTCEVGPGTYGGLASEHRFALATDLKQGDVIYLSCHIAIKSVTGLRRIGFEPKINGQYCGCWYSSGTIDFDGIITKSYTVSADVPAGTNLRQTLAYIQPNSGKTFTVADGGYARIDHLMMSIGQPAAWAPAEGETLTADGGGGDMTEPTNLVKTQPDETAIYTVEANGNYGHKDFLNSALGDGNIKLSATTSCHIGITIKPDKDIPSWHVWSWIQYKDDAGHTDFANSSHISHAIPAGVWTRLEWTVTVPAGMFARVSAISIDNLADETKFQATNFVVSPLTGGRIVRARGATSLVSVSDGAKGDKGDKGATGAKGDAGADGVSPIVSLSKSGSVTTISITDKNGTHTQTVLDGTNGTPGAKGADGRTPYFHVKYSNDGGKTFTANSGETVGTYIGTCTDYNSADPTTVGSYTWARIKGDTGAKGDTGKGATSIIEQYYLSTSSTTQAGGSWSTTQPTWSSGKYIWTRSHITWTDGTTTNTTPVLAGGLNSANQNAFNANNTANNANNTANNANNTANSAQSTANSAQSTANCKNAIFYATSAPSGSHKVNDVWFDTAHGNKMYYWTGSTWSSGLFDTAAIKDGAVTGKLIAGRTITGDKIASRTIVATNIAAATITANEILGGTITADKIASRTLTADKIKAGAITSNEIAAGTITADNIASRAITADRIKAGALTATEIAAGTITADKVNMSSLQSNIGYIGNKSGRHVEITSDAVKVMADASTVLGYFGSTINIRNAFTVDASGNGSFTGKIMSSSGQIGGWTITNTDLSRNYTNNGFSCSTNLMGGKIVFSGAKTETINGQDTRKDYSINMDEMGLYFVGSNTAVYNGQDGETDAVYGKFNYDTRYDTSFTFQTWYHEPGGNTHQSFMNADRISTTGNVQANTFNSIKLKDLIKTKYLTASNKKFVKNGSSNNTISVPGMSGYNIMGVYAATIDSDKVYPYNYYYDAGNKVFHVLGHNISGADVTTAIHGVAFYIANV